MARRKRWYLVTYDISCKKSLIKVHRLLCRQGVAAQKSVFFVLGSETDIHRLFKRISKIIQGQQIDIRAYPIISPDRIWTAGHFSLAGFPVYQVTPKSRFNRVLTFFINK